MSGSVYFSLKNDIKQVFEAFLSLKDSSSNVQPDLKLKQINKILDECDYALSPENRGHLSDSEISFFEETKVKAEFVTKNLLLESEKINKLQETYMNDIGRQANIYKKSVQRFSDSGGKGFYDIAIVIKNNKFGIDDPNEYFRNIYQKLSKSGHDILIFDIKSDEDNKTTERTVLMPMSSFSAFCREFDNPSSNLPSFPVASSFKIAPYYLLPIVNENVMDIQKARRHLEKLREEGPSCPFPVEDAFTSLGYLRSEISTKFDIDKKEIDHVNDLEKTMLFTFDQMGNYSDSSYRQNGIVRTSDLINPETLKGKSNSEHLSLLIKESKIPSNVRTHIELMNYNIKNKNEDSLGYPSM